MRDALDNIVRAVDPPTLVVEADGARRAMSLDKSGIIDWAEDRGLHIVGMSRAHACREICGESSLRSAAAYIARRYDTLTTQLLDARGELHPGIERWHALQPLVTAFVLAHAFAARSVINAFGGLIPPRPRSQQHDRKFP